MSKSVKLDKYQNQAKTSLLNSIVMAGAGSGKTMVLAERYLYLVVEKKVLPEEILTLTFTQKAASEMYQRIYRKLSQSQAPEARFAADHFETASISTIDAFCGEIARAGSYEFGLPSQFQYQTKSELSTALSLDFLIQNHGNKILEKFIYSFGFDRIWKDFFVKLCSEHFYLTSFFDFKALFKKQIVFLKDHLAETVRLWEKAEAVLLDLEGTQKSLEKNKALLWNLEMRQVLESGDYKELIAALKFLKFSSAGAAKSENLQIMKEIVNELKDLKDKLIQILGFLNKEEDLFSFALTLQQFYNDFLNHKRNTLQTDFNDIAYLAQSILLKNKDIRQYYKNKFKYIMIDEFQDNSILQKNLLYLVAEKKDLFSESIPEVENLEPGKLYFVGDEKQSIYRFRSADVCVFKGLKSELIRTGGKAIELPFNYRSEPGLIGFFNQLFPHVFGEGDKPYEAGYKSLKPREDNNPVIPQIHFLYKAYDPEELKTNFSNTELEAYNLAKYIKKLISEKTLLIKKEGEILAADYTDVALLLRSTSNQNVYERMFRLFQVPYYTENVRSLFIEAPLYDFYNILQLASDPSDESAYASFLRSPFVGISDHTLLLLLENPLSLFSLPPDYDEKELKKTALAKKLFEEIYEMKDVLPVKTLVSHLWYKGGYRFFILSQPENHHYLEFFDYILAMARHVDQEQRGLSFFLEQIQENLGKFIKQEDIKLLESDNQGLAILSVHRSKGLEFPVVLVADMGNRGMPQGEGGHPFYYDQDYGPAINWGEGNYFYCLAEERKKEEEEAEIKRLFYVALTRAQNHLVLSGVHHRGNRNHQSVFLNLFIQALNAMPEKEKTEGDFKIIQKIIENIDQDFLVPVKKAKTQTREFLASQIYRALPLVSRNFVSPEIAVTSLTGIYENRLNSDKNEKLPSFPIDEILVNKEYHAAFGVQVHYSISQKLLFPHLALEVLPQLKDLFSKSKHEFILEQTQQFINAAFFEDVVHLLKKSLQVLSEYSFYYLWNEEPLIRFKGIIDLIIEKEDKVYVIDFKTDLNYDPQVYVPQLTLYSLAAGEIFSKPVETYLLPVRVSRLDPLNQRLEVSEMDSLIREYYETAVPKMNHLLTADNDD